MAEAPSISTLIAYEPISVVAQQHVRLCALAPQCLIRIRCMHVICCLCDNIDVHVVLRLAWKQGMTGSQRSHLAAACQTFIGPGRWVYQLNVAT